MSLYLTIVGISVELIHSVESKSSGFISLLTSLVLASFEFFTSNSLQKAQSYWMNQSKPTVSEQHSREEDSQGWWPSKQSWRGGTCPACQTCCAKALTIRSQPGGGQGVYIELEALRLEICRDRRSCKIFPSCVKFWGNNENSLGNYRVTYALNE